MSGFVCYRGVQMHKKTGSSLYCFEVKWLPVSGFQFCGISSQKLFQQIKLTLEFTQNLTIIDDGEFLVSTHGSSTCC